MNRIHSVLKEQKVKSVAYVKKCISVELKLAIMVYGEECMLK